MAGSTFYGTTNNQYITVGIVWESEVDAANNQSVVTASLYARKSASSSSDTHGPGEWRLYINGVRTNISKNVTLNNDNEWVKLGTATVTVPHNADGTKSIQIYATGGITYTSYTTTSISATVALDAVPRATAPTFDVSEKLIGTGLVITLNRADPGFTHKVMYSWQDGLATGTIGENIGTSVTWTIPLSFISQIPSAASGVLTISVITYNASGTVVGGETGSVTCTVPASVVPTITGIGASDTGGAVPGAWGVFVKGKSRLHVAVAAAGAYGSSITGYQITALGTTLTSNNVDVGVIATSGSVSISVRVTDSRGRSAESSTTIDAVDYAEPVIEDFKARRVNDQAVPVDNGTFCRATLKASGTDVNGRNTVTARIYHKRSDLAEWTLARTISVAYSVDTNYMIADMVPSRSYAYKVEVADQFSVSTMETTLPAEGAVIGWMPGGVGVSFGKAAEEEDRADFGWKIHGRLGAKFDEPLGISSGGHGGTTTAEGRENLEVNYRTFKSVAQLGLTSGSATLNQCLSALPTYSILWCEVDQLAPSERPNSAVGYIEIIKTFAGARSGAKFYGKNPWECDWRQFTKNDGSAFTGVWYKYYTTYEPIPISGGGFGGTTAAEALANLGAAPANHGHVSANITDLKATILNWFYPPGTIYETDEPINPNTVFGGTWVRIQDKFLVAAGATFVMGTSGGSLKHAHDTPVAYTGSYQGVAEVNGHVIRNVGQFRTSAIEMNGSSLSNQTVPLTSEEYHLPPYQPVFVWKRTA